MNKSAGRVPETVIDRAELEKRVFLSVTTRHQSPRDIRGVVSELAHQLGSQVDLVDLISEGGKGRLAVHTETIYQDKPLRYFLLGCLRSSQTGGETTVFDARVAANLILEQAPELASVKIEYRSGSHPSHAVHGLVQNRSLRVGPQPVLVFREQAHTNKVFELPAGWTEKEFYSYMASVLAKSIATRHKWSAGDVLIVDNHVSLHGRELFCGARALIRARVHE